MRGVIRRDDAISTVKLIHSATRKDLVRTVLRWYRGNGRVLPWRGIRDPYRILVSEIMLQQTQVTRVLEKYPLFIKTFPTLHDLARAPRAAVIRTWQGMGYNNRAVWLHILAQIVVDKHMGQVPNDYDSLHELPGIGQYTARAILSSAFAMVQPVVDINVRRLFSRLFWTMPSAEAMCPEFEIWSLATRLLPQRASYHWNQALMDIGATICTARTPRCTLCPLVGFCRSRIGLQSPRTYWVHSDGASTARARPNGVNTRGVHSDKVRSPGADPNGNRSAVKREPSYRGVPNRLHRGRVVEQLRRVKEGSWITVGGLTRRVFKNSTKTDIHWVEKLLSVLERDGLVKVRKRQVGAVVRLG